MSAKKLKIIQEKYNKLNIEKQATVNIRNEINKSQIKNPKELLEFMDNITYGFLGKSGKKYTNANNEENSIKFNPFEIK